MFTRSDRPIAAAAFTDSGVFGWWHNMVEGSGAGFDRRFGTKGTGPGLAKWLELSPTFNLERVRTPLLMWGGEGTDMLLWDWFVGLKSLDKPVELWNFPTATHDVFQASHRLITNQLLIDWFVFWLKGEERSELLQGVNESERSLAQQYARWRFLRKQQEEVLKEPRPPLLKWTATALTDTFKTAEASPQ